MTASVTLQQARLPSTPGCPASEDWLALHWIVLGPQPQSGQFIAAALRHACYTYVQTVLTRLFHGFAATRRPAQFLLNVRGGIAHLAVCVPPT